MPDRLTRVGMDSAAVVRLSPRVNEAVEGNAASRARFLRFADPDASRGMPGQAIRDDALHEILGDASDHSLMFGHLSVPSAQVFRDEASRSPGLRATPGGPERGVVAA